MRYRIFSTLVNGDYYICLFRLGVIGKRQAALRFLGLKYRPWMQGLDTVKSCEVGYVERDDLGNIVGLHDCHKASVVHFDADDAVIYDQLAPVLEDLKGVREDHKKPFQLPCVAIRRINSEAQPVHANRPSADIPELGDILRGEAKSVISWIMHAPSVGA